MYTNKRLKPTLSPVTLAVSVALTMMSAAAAAQTVPDESDVQRSAEVKVVTDADKVSDSVSLDGVELELMPSSSGTVTDTLRSQSFIAFDRNSRNGARGAELAAPQISIRGSRPYENNFTINGLTNNNTLNPGDYTQDVGFGSLPRGDSQSMMLSTELLDGVEVYTENVSAQYGDFTGGVVNAKLRDARMDGWHGKVWTRTTRDAWARTSEIENDPFPQDEFKRYRAGVRLDGPLADGKLGALISYEREWSELPVTGISGTGTAKLDTERKNENLMLRLNTDPGADFYAAATVIYAPYSGTYEARLTKDGHYESEGGGWDVLLNTRASLAAGEWMNDFAFNRARLNRITNAKASYTWNPEPDGYANWEPVPGQYPGQVKAKEGLTGDIDQTQTTLNWRSVMQFNTVKTGAVSHDVQAGGEFKAHRVSLDKAGYTVFSSPMSDSAAVGDISNGVIAGEQFAMMKSVSAPLDRTQRAQTYALFATDTMKIDRVTVRPGLRVTYDSVSENVDVAPRLFADVDILGNGRYHINGGLNRYYGTQIMSQYLYADGEVQGYMRGKADGAWKPQKRLSTEGRDWAALDTPYADEITLGASVDVWDTTVKLQGVKRDFKDQLLMQKTVDNSDRKNPITTNRLTNDGSSKYRGLTLSVAKAFDAGAFGMHRGTFSLTRSAIEGNMEGMENTWTQSVPELLDPDTIYIDGKPTPIDEKSANNFNPDWTLTYAHEAAFMDERLRTMALLRYESSADRLKAVKNYRAPDGNLYKAYETHKQKAIVNVDLTAQYDLVRLKNGTTVTFDLEVLNVFNHTSYVDTQSNSSVTGSSTMGRQFFVGLSAQF